LRENANIRVDLVDGWLSASVLRWRNIVADVGALILFAIIQVKIWRLVELGAQQTIIGTPFSSDIVYLALAVGSAWGIVVITVRLVLDLTGR
jgi:TRAP-type C4-dicarboxylate transport system permease small subunit